MEKLSQKALERKSNKPIMEKKRRARINHCLNQLKSLILETDSERSRHSKLEKADILEMTVRYLQTLRAYHLYIQQIHQVQHQQQAAPNTANINPNTPNQPQSVLHSIGSQWPPVGQQQQAQLLSCQKIYSNYYR